ncbi:MAG: class I SAM-dependent methyltransferase [Candidatus Aminicenantes bacterium]|nr:class I SAM-dependent methyltransferase [Candidatus Aminicenantes bacterium]
MTPAEGAVAGSFRDPSGFLFWRDGTLYRQIESVYREHYDRLMTSGLYRELHDGGMLVGHEECPVERAARPGAYKVIRPEMVPFVSYPYEWCFSQLRDAARLTLAVQKKALEHGMSLKDASAYNVQFVDGRPQLIDTLSFELYPEGRPWVAYRQFCQHFLAPLALMAHRDVRLNPLSRIHLDGVPLDLASALLPARTRLAFSLLSHVHLHARSQQKYADRPLQARQRPMSRFALRALIDSLESAVAKLRWHPRFSEWSEYYAHTNYSDQAAGVKKRRVDEFLGQAAPRRVWDLGANTGEYSRLASGRGIPTVALDIDAAAVEKNYRRVREENDPFLLPLVGDLTNPSPGVGWENRERMSLLERGPVDLVMALALVHHLAISNNLPFGHIARLFGRLAEFLIIEFIPKNDSQVGRLLATREDVFPTYHAEGFEAAFGEYFTVVRRERVEQSDRLLYLMRRKNPRRD